MIPSPIRLEKLFRFFRHIWDILSRYYLIFDVCGYLTLTKKCPKPIKTGLAIAIAATIFLIVLRNCGFAPQFGKNPISDAIVVIALCLFSFGEILLFPACIVGMLQEDIFKKGEKLTGEVLFSVFCYILCLLVLAAYIYAFLSNNSFINCMKGFYSLSDDSGIIGLVQIMSGTIINTVLLGLLVSIFQRYIKNDK